MQGLLHTRVWPRAALALTLVGCFVVQAAMAAVGPPQLERDQERPPQEQQAQNPERRIAGEEADDDGATPDPDATTLLLTPSRFEASLGARLRLTLTALAAHDLRRLPVTVRFDPEVLRFVSARLGDAWDGRPEPILLQDASRAGELVIGLAQMNRDAPGLFGAAELLELEFEAIGRGDAGLTLDRFAAITDRTRAREAVAVPAEIVIR